eukprot:s2941_g13.t1
MASSDRSRSPPDAHSFPGFPVWRGPMGAAIRAAQSRPETQRTPAFRPMWQPPSGPYHMPGPYARSPGPASTGIRSSAFTQRLDIEGCDPLALPVAALLYQQADNFWLRKLAHGRELYLIPTGDIAAVVFGTELLSQLRTRGIDLDRVSHCRARQDGQTLDKINNTKYAAKVVAEHIQQWVPMKATDPSSQHTITQLQQQVAELKQRLGDTSDAAPPDSSTPPPPSTSSPSAPPPSTPIQRALQGNAATPPPEFEPASLLVAPLTQNSWLKDNTPTSVAVRSYNQWYKDLNLTPAQRATVERNLAKVEESWQNQPESAVDTVQRTALVVGIPVSILKGNFNETSLVKVLTIALTMSC